MEQPEPVIAYTVAATQFEPHPGTQPGTVSDSMAEPEQTTTPSEPTEEPSAQPDVPPVSSDEAPISTQVEEGTTMADASTIGTLNVVKEDCQDNDWFGKTSATDIAILGQLSSLQNQQAAGQTAAAVQNGDLKFVTANLVRDAAAGTTKEVNDGFKETYRYMFEHQKDMQKEFCSTRELVREKFEAVEIRRLEDKLDAKELKNTELQLKISQMEQTNAILIALRAAGINVGPSASA